MMFSTSKAFHIDYLNGETPLSDVIDSKSDIQVQDYCPTDGKSKGIYQWVDKNSTDKEYRN